MIGQTIDIEKCTARSVFSCAVNADRKVRERQSQCAQLSLSSIPIGLSHWRSEHRLLQACRKETGIGRTVALSLSILGPIVE